MKPLGQQRSFSPKNIFHLPTPITHNSIPFDPSDTDIDISGPIILTSTGETVGTFNQLYTWDIQILDKDGTIIKKKIDS